MAMSDTQALNTMNEYVARARLPEHLTPGSYRIQVNRDGASWVDLEGQSFDVIPDPPPVAEYSVSDPRFGGCRPDDGADDTACIVRAMAAAAHAGGGSVYFGAGTWDLIDSSQPGLAANEGILVPAALQLPGAGIPLTRPHPPAAWHPRPP